jgi:hypothetical protein
MIGSASLAILLHLVILGVVPFPNATPPSPIILELELAPSPMVSLPQTAAREKKEVPKTAKQNAQATPPTEVPVIPSRLGDGVPSSLVSAPTSVGTESAKAENTIPSAEPSPPMIERPKTVGESRFAALPAQGEIDYQVSLGSLDMSVARGTLRWKITGQRYHLDLEARTVGIARLLKSNPVTQISEGRIGPQGLVPDFYRVLGRASETDEVEAQFDWVAQTLTLQPGNTVIRMQEGTQDLLSFFFQFSIVPPEMEGASRFITNGRKLDRYSYELTEQSRLKLPLGEVDVLHVSRLTGLNEDSFDIWLGEKYHLLPVQIRFFARGRTITLYAKDIRIAAPGPDSN